jgi:hypothetical protein
MFGALVVSLLLAQTPPDLTVYVFTTTDCPISNRYAPEIERLATQFKPHARFVLVYPVQTDTAEKITEHRRKFAYTIESARDLDQKLVKLTGVAITPEVAVMKGNQRLYRGRIDDRFVDFGRERARPTQHDLKDALTAITTGKAVANRETQAVGCYLADLIK